MTPRKPDLTYIHVPGTAADRSGERIKSRRFHVAIEPQIFAAILTPAVELVRRIEIPRYAQLSIPGPLHRRCISCAACRCGAVGIIPMERHPLARRYPAAKLGIG